MVRCGIERINEYESLFKGKRIGLITSVSGVTAELQPSIDIFRERYNLAALFAPEHGVRGDRDAGETVDTYIDQSSGVKVYSLYRADSKRLTDEMLEKVDMVVYDIQDIGARYYTFISTMMYALEDCARQKKEFVVLDRPNPLGGNAVEGGILEESYKSFVGCYPMPARYGLTAGELAVMINRELNLNCDLKIIPCTGYTRDMLYPDTGRLWMMPSLGVPRFETALLYIGTCLLEGTNASEGRGTSCPFEIIGAEYIKNSDFCNEMNSRKLPGVIFTTVYFTPAASKHAGKSCAGIHIHLTDYRKYKPLETGLNIIDALQKLYPQDFKFLPASSEKTTPFINLLSGNNYLYSGKKSIKEITDIYNAQSEEFKIRKASYHLY